MSVVELKTPVFQIIFTKILAFFAAMMYNSKVKNIWRKPIERIV